MKKIMQPIRITCGPPFHKNKEEEPIQPLQRKIYQINISTGLFL